MPPSPAKLLVAWSIAWCLACAHGRPGAPVEGVDGCTAVRTEDGRTLVTSETHGYAVVLAGVKWRVECPREPYPLLSATEPNHKFRVQLGSSPAGSRPIEEAHRDFTTAVVDRMILAYELPNPQIVAQPEGDDGRMIECFGGPIVFNGVDAHLYGCTSVKPIDDRYFEYSVVSISARAIWLDSTRLLSTAVRKLATLWWPIHEVPAEVAFGY